MNTNPLRRESPADHQDLAELLPAPGHPVLSRDRHRVLREHLMAHITHESTEESAEDSTRERLDATGASSSASPVSPGPRRPRRRLVLVAAPLALAAVVGLGAVVVDGVRDGGHGTAATAGGPGTAAQLLDRIALAAADQPVVTVRDDQYIYTKSQGSARELGVDFGVPEELMHRKGPIKIPEYKGAVRREQWDSVNGKQNGLRKGVAVSDPAKTMTMRMIGVGYLTFRQLQALPTDPDALLKKFSGDVEGSQARRTEWIVENVGAILDDATLLPDLSAAIYRAMAGLSGVGVVEHVKDAAGREGVGLTFAGAPKGYAWVFDATSLKYLGTTKSALLDAGVADKRGEVPGS
ncbi:hypothetical protein OK074_3386 [Actinobacteria bacterium OK074]|nr:hypothetical protein OK074_3386 [Actinobacteria bacterium OK074]